MFEDEYERSFSKTVGLIALLYLSKEPGKFPSDPGILVPLIKKAPSWLCADLLTGLACFPPSVREKGSAGPEFWAAFYRLEEAYYEEEARYERNSQNAA